MTKKIRIFGAGVRASIVVDLISWQFIDQYFVEGYYDDRFSIGSVGPRGYPVLGNVAQGLKETYKSGTSVFIALGTKASAFGWEVFLALNNQSIDIVNLVSPSAHISPSSQIGQNSLVLPGVYVGCEARIGNMFCAHGGSVVEHHCKVGNNVLLGPGVAIASKVTIGHHTFVGAGSQIIPEMSIGSGTILGAGSLVVRDIPSYVVAYGQPATPMRNVRSGDEVPTEQDIKRFQ